MNCSPERFPSGPSACDGSLEKAARDLRRRQAQGPPAIRQRNAQVDKRLARLIESCLALEADRRPKGPAELAASCAGNRHSRDGCGVGQGRTAGG